jgi:5-methylcytosine-specific restriction endonuclease McrA
MRLLNATPEALAKKRAWQQTEAGRRYRQQYNRSDKRRAVLRRSAQSARGRERLLRGRHKRRALMLGQTAVESRLTAQEWEKIKAAHGYGCLYCGTTERPLTRDHVVPLSLGGQHVKENVVPACQNCNSRRGAALARARKATICATPG